MLAGQGLGFRFYFACAGRTSHNEDVCVTGGKAGDIYLVEADTLGIMYDRKQVVDLCGAVEDPCSDSNEGLIINEPRIGWLDGSAVVVIATHSPDHSHGGGCHSRKRSEPRQASHGWKSIGKDVLRPLKRSGGFVLLRPAPSLLTSRANLLSGWLTTVPRDVFWAFASATAKFWPTFAPRVGPCGMPGRYCAVNYLNRGPGP